MVTGRSVPSSDQLSLFDTLPENGTEPEAHDAPRTPPIPHDRHPDVGARPGRPGPEQGRPREPDRRHLARHPGGPRGDDPGREPGRLALQPGPRRTAPAVDRTDTGRGRRLGAGPADDTRHVAFRPRGQDDLAPPGAAAKLTANLAALDVLDRLRREARPPQPGEQAALARWSGWGAIPQIFDESRDDFTAARQRARRLLGTDEAWEAARRTTLNAHYTSADVIAATWAILGELGFDGGRVLEPGCGSGNFIGLAPDSAEMVGVELDPTTAEIARHLYGPRAQIHQSRFEDFSAQDGSFDAAIGNVPFAKLTPHDPRHNRHRLALHSYCIAKSLQLVAPGGTVALLTSRYTLDARNPTARRVLHELADLVGAVRLPAGAFAASSGTDVVTDLLVLRRRPDGREPADDRWLAVDALDTDGDPVHVNAWYRDHPDLVLGDLTVEGGMYRQHELTVRATGDLADQLTAARARIVERADALDLRHAPQRSSRAAELPARPAPVVVDEGSFVVDGPGFGRVENGTVVAYEPRVAKDAHELRRLIALRDAAHNVLTVQANGGDDHRLAAAQRGLNETYDAYARVHGPLNRFKLARTGRTDPDTGEERMRRLRPRMGGFRDDPGWPLVAALEMFDDDTQQATKAPIFHTRVIEPPMQRLGVDTPEEAVAVCLDETGRVDLDRIADLLGTTIDDARTRLDGQVYEDPATGDLEPAARYLSGNVRTKLDHARAAAADDPRFQATSKRTRTAPPSGTCIG